MEDQPKRFQTTENDDWVRRLRRWVLCRGCDYHHWVDAGTGRKERCSVCHNSVFDSARPWSLAKLAGY
jgi:hypothetical protein